MIDSKENITSEEEKSIAETYDLDGVIKNGADRYTTIGKILCGLTKEGLDLRTIGEMVGILARADTNLNKRMVGREIPLFSDRAHKIRDILGMRVLEDP